LEEHIFFDSILNNGFNHLLEASTSRYWDRVPYLYNSLDSSFPPLHVNSKLSIVNNCQVLGLGEFREPSPMVPTKISLYMNSCSHIDTPIDVEGTKGVDVGSKPFANDPSSGFLGNKLVEEESQRGASCLPLTNVGAKKRKQEKSN
jgi:hypothetical protein